MIFAIAAAALVVSLDTQSVPVRDLARLHVRLARRERRMIDAVLAASPRDERPKLIVTRFGNHNLILWYGDPEHPYGVRPDSSAGRITYHVLDAGCNVFMKPYERDLFVAPECQPLRRSVGGP